MKSWIVRETPRSFIWGPKSYFAWCNDCAERKKPCLADWYQVKNAVWEQAWPGTSSRSAADVPMEHFLCISRGGSGGASHDGISICAAPPMIPSARAIDRCHR